MIICLLVICLSRLNASSIRAKGFCPISWLLYPHLLQSIGTPKLIIYSRKQLKEKSYGSGQSSRIDDTQSINRWTDKKIYYTDTHILHKHSDTKWNAPTSHPHHSLSSASFKGEESLLRSSLSSSSPLISHWQEMTFANPKAMQQKEKESNQDKLLKITSIGLRSQPPLKHVSPTPIEIWDSFKEQPTKPATISPSVALKVLYHI